MIETPSLVDQYCHGVLRTELGLGTFERPRQALFLNGPSATEREYSEDTARMIDLEVRTLLQAGHDRVRETLTAKRTVLEKLAKVLIEQEVVDRDTLTTLLAAQVTPSN